MAGWKMDWTWRCTLPIEKSGVSIASHVMVYRRCWNPATGDFLPLLHLREFLLPVNHPKTSVEQKLHGMYIFWIMVHCWSMFWMMVFCCLGLFNRKFGRNFSYQNSHALEKATPFLWPFWSTSLCFFPFQGCSHYHTTKKCASFRYDLRNGAYLRFLYSIFLYIDFTKKKHSLKLTASLPLRTINFQVL